MDRFRGRKGPEYSLLTSGATGNDRRDSDTDGNGGIELGIIDDNYEGEEYTQSGSLKSVLKKTHRSPRIIPSSTRRIHWGDIESEAEDDEEDDDDNREALLSSRENSRKRKRSMIRRLSAIEKEELYASRPDLKIVPNWAHKYREEMMAQRSDSVNRWLICLIVGLIIILVFCILMIFAS